MSAPVKSNSGILPDANVIGNAARGTLKFEAGNDVFTTTGLTKEVDTALTTCICAVVTPVDPAPETAAGEDIMFCDRVITTSAITVEREDDGTSGMAFNYLFIGF